MKPACFCGVSTVCQEHAGGKEPSIDDVLDLLEDQLNQVNSTRAQELDNHHTIADSLQHALCPDEFKQRVRPVLENQAAHLANLTEAVAACEPTEANYELVMGQIFMLEKEIANAQHKQQQFEESCV